MREMKLRRRRGKNIFKNKNKNKKNRVQAFSFPKFVNCTRAIFNVSDWVLFFTLERFILWAPSVFTGELLNYGPPT